MAAARVRSSRRQRESARKREHFRIRLRFPHTVITSFTTSAPEITELRRLLDSLSDDDLLTFASTVNRGISEE